MVRSSQSLILLQEVSDELEARQLFVLKSKVDFAKGYFQAIEQYMDEER